MTVAEATWAASPTAAATAPPDEGALGIRALDPLSFLDALEEATLLPLADSALTAALIGPGDLPAGFLPFLEQGLRVPLETGEAETAARGFARAEADTGTFVLHIVMRLPPGGRQQMEAQGWPPALGPAELERMMKEAAATGLPLRQVRALDVAGLRGEGMGIQMVLALQDSAQTPWDQRPEEAMAMDFYLLAYGEHLSVLIVGWPHDRPSGVDSAALARAADAKVSAVLR